MNPQAWVRLGMKNEGFRKGLDEAKRDLKGFSSSAMSGFGGGLSMRGGILAGAIGLSGFSAKLAMDRETAETQFEVLLGSAEDARKRLDEITEFANKTPFQMPEVRTANRILEKLTRGALSGARGMTMLGDAAAMSGEPIDQLAIWFGRLYDGIQSGRPVGEALARLQELAIISGETRTRIEEMQKAGESSAKVWREVEQGMARFSGTMEKLSETSAGKASTAIDNLKSSLTGLGALFAPIIGWVSKLTIGIVGLSKAAGDHLSDLIPGRAAENRKLQSETEEMQKILDLQNERVERMKAEQDQIRRIFEGVKSTREMELALIDALARAKEDQLSSEEKLLLAQQRLKDLRYDFNRSDLSARAELTDQLVKATEDLYKLEVAVNEERVKAAEEAEKAAQARAQEHMARAQERQDEFMDLRRELTGVSEQEERQRRLAKEAGIDPEELGGPTLAELLKGLPGVSASGLVSAGWGSQDFNKDALFRQPDSKAIQQRQELIRKMDAFIAKEFDVMVEIPEAETIGGMF